MTNKFLKNKKIVITGGAGFIGSNLAARLVKEGAIVRIVDNLERGQLEFVKPIQKKIQFLKVDLREKKQVHRALKGMDILFHLAAKVGGIKVYQNQPGTVLNQNVLIDQNIFSTMIELKIPRVFYASSSHVYPEERQTDIESPALKEDEAEPARPALSYGWGKLVGEKTLLELTKEYPWLKVSIARIVGAYGYNQDIGLETGSVIPVFCHRAIRWPLGAPFKIWSSGDETRSYCFIDDIVEGILRSVYAQETGRIVGPFNLGAEGRVSIKKIAETIVAISKKNIPLSFTPSAKTTIWGQAVDCKKAHQLLQGWRPQYDLEKGLRRTYAHVKARVKASQT